MVRPASPPGSLRFKQPAPPNRATAQSMPPAPRVNKATLDGFIGKPITLVGKDGPNVIATRPAGTAQPSPGQVLECLGTGTATGVETIRIVELGESFDLSKYELLVQAIHGKHKSLFM